MSADHAPVLTRLDLDEAGCANPGCTHEQHQVMFVHPQCHPRAGTRVEYRRDGVLRFHCRECRAHVLNVRVAETPS